MMAAEHEHEPPPPPPLGEAGRHRAGCGAYGGRSAKRCAEALVPCCAASHQSAALPGRARAASPDGGSGAMPREGTCGAGGSTCGTLGMHLKTSRMQARTRVCGLHVRVCVCECEHTSSGGDRGGDW